MFILFEVYILSLLYHKKLTKNGKTDEKIQQSWFRIHLTVWYWKEKLTHQQLLKLQRYSSDI